MAGSATVTTHVHVRGGDAVLRAFRALPAEANDALRDASMDLARTLSGKVQASARSDSAQSALMASTVRARRDRVPVIVAGGSSRVGRNRVPAFKILFGSEFGARRLPQFRDHFGGSYWFFDTVEHEQGAIAAAWRRAADDIVDAFGRGA